MPIADGVTGSFKPYQDPQKNRDTGYMMGSEEEDPLAFLNEFINYKSPQADINRKLNLLGQMLSAQQGKAEQGFSQRQAGKTGGRLGSTERGFGEIAGQFALAGQQGSAAVLNEAADREIKVKLAGLSAYIQKYGIDKNAQIALKRLKQEREIMESQAMADLFSSLPSGDLVSSVGSLF